MYFQAGASKWPPTEQTRNSLSLEDRLEPRFKTKTFSHTPLLNTRICTGCAVLSQNGFIPFSLQHIGSLPIVLGQAKGPALSLFLVFLYFFFFFFFVHVMCLVGSQFPDQGLNPSHRSESPESYPLGYQGTPSSCVSCGICSWLLGVSAGFSSWQSWELGPLERAGCPVCVCFWEKDCKERPFGWSPIRTGIQISAGLLSILAQKLGRGFLFCDDRECDCHGVNCVPFTPIKKKKKG